MNYQQSYGQYVPDIQSTSTSHQNGVKCLVYGRSGVGKTRLAKTCPHPLILSAESGLLSLRRDNLPYVHIDSPGTLSNVLSWLERNGDNWTYQSIMIDSLSEIAEDVLKNAKVGKKDPRQAYGTLIDEMIPLAKRARDLRYRHVIVTCKEEWQKDEASGSFMYQPSMPGKAVGADLPYFFDEVFRYVVGIDRTTNQPWAALQTYADWQSVAKDRSGALNPYELPDMGAIFTKIAT